MFRYVVIWDDGPDVYSSVMFRAPKWLSLGEVKFLTHVHLKDAIANGYDLQGKDENNFMKVEIHIE